MHALRAMQPWPQAARHACVEVQAVDAAILTRDVICQLAHRVVVGLVQREEGEWAWLRVEPGVARGADDRGTRLGEPVGRGIADARRCPSDQDDLAREILRMGNSFRLCLSWQQTVEHAFTMNV